MNSDLARLDPAVALALETYRANGFARLRGFFPSQEIEDMRREADRLGALDAIFGDPARGGIRTGDPRPDRIDPVIDVSPLFAGLAMGEPMLRLAGSMLGGKAQLFKDKLISKPAGAKGYGVHQDIAYWQELGLRQDAATTIALCLDRCTAENGAVEFAPGFHHRLLTTPGVVEDPDEAMFPEFVTVTAEPGDLLLFTALAPHRSGLNRSGDDRRILFLTYACDERPGLYEHYQAVRQDF